ncbi:MAG: LuxR C-terminal-related transcriptional regulator [Treponema sp.]|nr:LuxR C-terminal-related transcriptional regulator [Treponema sp.]
MANNSVIIASTANFLIDTLRTKLKDLNLRVFTACSENDLYDTINSTFPRLIFIEHCFCGFDTDNYISKTLKFNQNLHFVIWTAYQINPVNAARFIHAGAESFISLRDTVENVENILFKISEGQQCYPNDVREALQIETNIPIFNKPLTPRELQIIKLFGLEDLEIAKQLSLAIQTVYFHKSNIFRKLGLKRKNEVLEYVIKNGVLTQWDFA